MAEIRLQNLAHSYTKTPGGPEDYAIREEDLPVIFEQYDILAREMIKREKSF